MIQTQKTVDIRNKTKVSIEKRLADKIEYTLQAYPRALKAFQIMENDLEIQTLLEDSNVMTMVRLGYSDHGHVHSLITTLHAITLLQYLKDKPPTVVEEGCGDFEDSMLVVTMATYLHDIGQAIHREKHYEWSVMLAKPILDRILSEIYSNLKKRIKIRNHILHAIYAHDKNTVALTIEAGLVGVADALDMTKGRARITFSSGMVNIHSASAMAINRVKIRKGDTKPITIEIFMSNMAGLFQVQELLAAKIKSSKNIRDDIEIIAHVMGEDEKVIDLSIN